MEEQMNKRHISADWLGTSVNTLPNCNICQAENFRVLKEKKNIFKLFKKELYHAENPFNIAPGMREYLDDFFLVSPLIYVLWVLIRSASVRHF